MKHDGKRLGGEALSPRRFLNAHTDFNGIPVGVVVIGADRADKPAGMLDRLGVGAWVCVAGDEFGDGFPGHIRCGVGVPARAFEHGRVFAEVVMQRFRISRAILPQGICAWMMHVPS